MERVFLDWRHPLLPAAAVWSIERARRQDVVDLSGEEHVLSGRRAARRYLELLVRHCEESGLAFDPPEILVPSQWELRHSRNSHGRTSVLELDFAFRAALRDAAPPTLGPLQVQADQFAWLARQLAQLVLELASRGSDLRAILAQPDRVALLPEQELLRLRALAQLESDVETKLNRCRRVWPKDAQLAPSQTLLVLVGIVEFPPLLQRYVDLYGATALVHAAAERAVDFDAYGQPLRSAWAMPQQFVDELDIQVASDPAQEAALAVERLSELATLSVDDVVVGLLDRQIERPLRALLEARGHALHDADGFAVERHPLWLALSQLVQLRREQSFAALAALARDPLVEARLREHLGAKAQPVEWLDRYQRKHLPHGIAGPTGSAEASAVQPIFAWCASLGAELAGEDRALGAWAPALRHCIDRLCGAERYDTSHPSGRRSLLLLRAAAEALERFEALPRELQPLVDGPAAAELLLQELRAEGLSELPEPNAIEAVGWLELATDDAPHLLLLGANEGRLPLTPAHDSILPDALRGGLGLPCDADRETRDLYLLARLWASHQSCRIVLARHDLGSAPLLPSRLLLRGTPERLPQRLRQLFEAVPRRAVWAPQQLAAVDDARVRSAPRLQPQAIERLSVTAFADWLRCPYRFHLSRVLKLRAHDHEARELDAAAVGTLLHGVLERFAQEASHLESATAIETWLWRALDERAAQSFGQRTQPAVRVQIELLRQRLRAFARVQAERHTAGWRIVRSEAPLAWHIEIDGIPIELVAQIDRVDQHLDGHFAILDTKTGDQAVAPRQAHGPDRAGVWKDLQLPLYLRLARAVWPEFASAEVELGYLHLPRDSRDAGVALANWEEVELEDAWRCAQEVVRGIRSGVGLEAPSRLSGRRDDYALICRSDVFEESDE